MEERRAHYEQVRDRTAVALKPKHVRQYDREFEAASQARPGMSVLEIGCGTGIFLRYLERKGYRGTVAVDHDAALAPVLADLSHTELLFGDISVLAEGPLAGRRFDRIALFDVIEHVERTPAISLVRRLGEMLNEGGRLVIRTPNLSSPWGVHLFFNDLDHVTPFTPIRMRELAALCGLRFEGAFPQVPNKWSKRIGEAIVHGLLDRALSYRPEIWSANFVAVLAK